MKGKFGVERQRIDKQHNHTENHLKYWSEHTSTLHTSSTAPGIQWLM